MSENQINWASCNENPAELDDITESLFDKTFRSFLKGASRHQNHTTLNQDLQTARLAIRVERKQQTW